MPNQHEINIEPVLDLFHQKAAAIQPGTEGYDAAQRLMRFIEVKMSKEPVPFTDSTRHDFDIVAKDITVEELLRAFAEGKP